MKQVKSLYILAENCVTTFPIDSILSVKITNKLIDICLIDGRQETFNLRLSQLLNCVFDLTNYAQFFFVKEGMLLNPIHTEITKLVNDKHVEYEIATKLNTVNLNFSLPEKALLTQLKKGKLLVKNTTDGYMSL
jgi:hypothetical protein